MPLAGPGYPLQGELPLRSGETIFGVLRKTDFVGRVDTNNIQEHRP